MTKAVVFMKGGFGNQLFQIAFANYLKLQGFNVFLNTSFFRDDGFSTPRQMIFPPNYYGLEGHSNLQNLKFKFFYRLNRSRKLKFLSNTLEEYKFSTFFVNSNDIKAKNLYFNGYWKDLKFLEPTKNIIIESLKKNKDLKKGFDNNNFENCAMIHVRRGDFLRDNRHLKSDYFIKSIEILKKNDIHDYDIFTDDKKWVENQKFFSRARNIYSQNYGQDEHFKSRGINSKDDKQETIYTFGKMLSYNHFVVGNSSYSFWAAYLKSTSRSTVTIADPMFRNENRTNIYKDSWIKIPNE